MSLYLRLKHILYFCYKIVSAHYMKVALIQDWLTELGGAEKVFAEILKMYPEADIYTLVASDKVTEKLNIKGRVTESFICHLPFAKKWYRKYLQFFPLAIEGFDLSEYDLIISSSSSVAKNILTHSNQIHISYCHSPARYVWDLCFKYLKEANLNRRWSLMSFYARKVMHKFRIWDVIGANRVDYFVANSNYISQRIAKVYRRDSVVIYPPVDVDNFSLNDSPREDFYFTASRVVPYKKIDLIVKAFASMPEKTLYVAGMGPDYKKIKKMATPNVKLLGYISDEEMKDYMSRAKAFVFAAEEDFGIVPVEAQACGTPVIAFGKGGALETVVDGISGVLFNEQTETSLLEAIARFEKLKFYPNEIRKNAEKFSTEHFVKNLKQFINDKMGLTED